MITPEIISFIKQQVSAGVSQEQITNSLKQNGWNDQDINEAFRVISGQNVPVTPISIPTPVPPSLNAIKPNKSKNGLLWSVIVILLIVILGGVFFFLKNNNAGNGSEMQTLATSTVTETSENQTPSSSPCFPNCPGAGMGQGIAVQSSSANGTSSVYTQSSGLYSFTYPKTSQLNPNFTLLVGDKGFYPVPPNVSPDALSIPSDPNTVQHTGVSLEVFGPASSTVADLAILADSNNVLLDKILAIIKNNGAQYTKSSFGDVDGFATDVYTISTATVQGQIAYVINIGQYQNSAMSLVILNISSTPPLAKNIPSVEAIIHSFVINSTVVQSYLQSLPASQAQASDASITSKFLQARSEAETYNGQSNNSYSGFCASNDFVAIKNSVSPASVSCHDSASAYAASVQLSSGYLCFDSTGRTVQNATAPAIQTVCGN